MRLTASGLLQLTILLLLSHDIISTTTAQSDNYKAMAPGLHNLTGLSGSSPNIYAPPQVPLEVDRYPRAPENLELEQVHLFVRHGERAPVGIRLSGPPANIPEHWHLCKAARRFRAAVSGMNDGERASHSHSAVSEGELQLRKVVERFDGSSSSGECLLGELTDIGRQSTYNYGLALRQLYVNKLGFLPDTLPHDNEAYFRSTNMPRTIESLQQIIHGLYPTSKCKESAVPIIRIRNGKDENLLGNTYSCKRLELLQIGFAQAAADAYNRTLEPLDKKISKYLNGNPIRIDGRPRASGVLDTIRASTANGVKVPPEFEDKSVIDLIEKAVVSEWFADKTEEVRRLGMGRMLDDMSRKMQHKVERREKDPLKILVHSTHDTAIAALCSTLDVYDEKWPAFTASITFELFRSNESKSQTSLLQNIFSTFTQDKSQGGHYIRMRYQNKNMILPMCSEDGKHLPGYPEFCSLKVFQERVKELTPVDWDAECSTIPK